MTELEDIAQESIIHVQARLVSQTRPDASPSIKADEAATLKANASTGALGFEPLPLGACASPSSIAEMRPPGFQPLNGRPGAVAVPASSADLTATFCTAAFRARDLLAANESVTKVLLTPLGAGEGEASDNFLMALEVDGEAPKLARTLVAKFTSAKMSSVEKAWNFSPEAHFYNDMTIEACGLVRPFAPYVGYAAATMSSPSRYCIIQEFCAPPAFLFKRYEGLSSVPHMLLVMRALARFHARWWGHQQDGVLQSYVHPDKLGGPFIHVPPFVTETALKLAWKHGLKALRHCWSDAPKYAGVPTFAAEYADFVESVRPLARRRRKALVHELGSRKPLTLIHGDAHLENIFFGPHYPGGVAFIDFGLLSFGPAMCDVATVIGGGMPTEARRAHEAQLVRAYYEALTTEYGVAGFSYEACWESYRFELIRPFLCVSPGHLAARTPRENASRERYGYPRDSLASADTHNGCARSHLPCPNAPAATSSSSPSTSRKTARTTRPVASSPQS